jgi:hypothetical protein
VLLAEFGLDGVEKHLPVFGDWVIEIRAFNFVRHLLQKDGHYPLNVSPQERADKPWSGRVASQRIPESEDPDGLFIV